MPILSFRVLEVASRIIDPVVDQVTQSVLSKLGIGQYFDNAIYIDNGRTAASRTDDGLGNINLQRNRCDVKVETLYNPSDQFWDTLTDHNTTAYGQSAYYADQYQSIYVDTQAKASIQEITTPFGITLTFTLAFRTYDAAQDALTSLISQNNGTVVNNTHDVVFSYPLSMSVLCALFAIYKCKVDYANKSFIDYLTDMQRSGFRFDIRRPDLGPHHPQTQLVVERQQLDCQALLEFAQSAPEPRLQENLPTAYTLEFTYRLQFGRPNILQMILPPVVDNTALPTCLFVDQPKSTLPSLPYTMQTSFFTQATKDLYARYQDAAHVVRFPHYDDFTLPTRSQLHLYKFNPLFIGIALLDPVRTEITLADLGDVTLHPFVKAILSQHTQADVLGFQGLFNITIFSDTLPLDPSLITFDPTTLVTTFAATRQSHTYRIVLSEQTDLTLLDPKWYPTLLQYRYFFPLTIARNTDFLLKLGYFTVQSDSSLTRLIKHTINTGRFEILLNTLITQGVVLPEARQFTQSVDQFADYICSTQQRAYAGELVTDQASRTICSAFVDLCVDTKIIPDSARPQQYLRTPPHYPYGVSQGGFARLQIPLRVFNVSINT